MSSSRFFSEIPRTAKPLPASALEHMSLELEIKHASVQSSELGRLTLLRALGLIHSTHVEFEIRKGAMPWARLSKSASESTHCRGTSMVTLMGCPRRGAVTVAATIIAVEYDLDATKCTRSPPCKSSVE